MRARKITALVAISLLALAGCGGGNQVTLDKTIAHDGGILNVGQVTSVSPKLEARVGDAQTWTDLTTSKENDIEAWFKGKQSAEARSYIQFDEAQLPLETRVVTSAGQLKDMQNDLENRMDAVDSFMKNKDKQLNARGW